MPDAFISYSRRNKEFVQKLAKSLADDGRDIWIDWEDIPVTADWLEEIYQGIRESDAFVFIITEDSVLSEVCGWELKYALENNKRLIPLLHKEIESEEAKAAMHPMVSSHNWIFCRETDDYDAMLKLLLEALDTDLEHSRAHTRILVRAREWDTKGRSNSFLFSGEGLTDAEQWLSHASGKEPEPTELQMQYIYESRKAYNRRQQLIVGASLGAAVISIILAIAAVIFFLRAEEQRQIAEDQRQIAEEQRVIAERNAEEAGSLALAANAQLALSLNDNDLAIALGQEAVQVESPPIQSQSILQDAVFSPGTRALFEGHQDSVLTVDFSPNGDVIASGSEDSTVRIWSTDGAEQNVIEGHEGAVNTVKFSADGTQLLTGSADATAVLWDLSTGEVVQTFASTDGDAHTDEVSAVDFSTDGTTIATGGADGLLILWNMATGEHQSPIVAHTDTITGVDFSPDGTQIATSSQDNRIKVWSVESGELIAENETDFPVTSVSYSPDGSQLLTSSGGFTVNTWTVNSENGTVDLATVFSGHLEWVGEVQFDPQGLLILSASNDDTVRLWNSQTGGEVNSFGGHTANVNDIAFSPDGRTAITASDDNTLRLIDLAHGLELERYNGHAFDVIQSQFIGDGSRAVSAAWDDTTIIWDLATGDIQQQISSNGFLDLVDINSDGTRMAFADQVVDDNAGAYLINLESGETTTTFDGHEGIVAWIDISPDDTLVASSTYGEESAFIWDANTGELVHELPVGSPSFHVAFSPDTALLASSSNSSSTILWDVESGEEVKRVSVGGADIGQATFSPDGSSILLQVGNRLVLMDIESENVLATFDGHSGSIRSYTYSQDGAIVLTGSQDGTLRLWDATTGEQLHAINTGIEIRSVGISPDGTQALTGAVDYSVRLWNIVPPTLTEVRDWAQANRLAITFTCDQRDQYSLEQTPECEAEEIQVEQSAEDTEAEGDSDSDTEDTSESDG